MAELSEVTPGAASRPSIAPSALARMVDPLPAFVATFLAAEVVICLIVDEGGILRFLFPVTALAAAIILFHASRRSWFVLVWWLWILAPEVRRLSDWQGGFDATNPIQLAPPLACLVCIPALLRGLPAFAIGWRRGFPLVAAGIAAGTAVGFVRASPLAALYGGMEWLLPVAIAGFLVQEWPIYPQYRGLVLRLSCTSLLVVGAYGVVQFFAFPGWDRYWAANSGLVEFATARAEHFRPFSTLNAPGTFAFIVLLLLITATQYQGQLRTPALAIGAVALALSQVRATWGLAVIALAYIVMAQHKTGGRSLRLIALLVVPILALAALSVPVGSVLQARVSQTTGSNDQSLHNRVDVYRFQTPSILTDPAGGGIGSIGSATRLSTSDNQVGSNSVLDSGILDVPFELGWFGAVLFSGGALLLVRRARRARIQDPFILAARATGLVALLFLIFAIDVTNASGFFVWVPLGLSLASISFYERRSKGRVVTSSLRRPA